MQPQDKARHTKYNEARLIRIREVMNLTGLSRSYVYELTARQIFPASVSLVPGGTSRAWVYAEVQDWLNQRIAERKMEASNE
jgi:prophage regulatory protein